MNKILSLILVVLSFITCSKKQDINILNKDKEKKLLSTQDLENAGFVNINGDYFEFLFFKDGFFLLNSKDKLIVKFNSQKKVLKAYQESGQGPGGMINPSQLLIFDNDTLAVFDNKKARILLFDFEINFLNEIKVDTRIRKIQKSNNGFVAFGDFGQKFGEKIFARLDQNLKVEDTFLTADTRSSLTKIPTILYMGYLLKFGNVVYTSWLYTKKDCFADIYNLNTKEKIVSLNWKNPHPPTKKDIDNMKDLYGSKYINKYGDFFIVVNSFEKSLKEKDIYIYKFKNNGELYSRCYFPYDIIYSNSTATDENDSRLFFIDHEEGISYLDVNEL